MKKLLLTLATIFVSSLVMGQIPTENYILSTTFQTETPTGSVTDDEKIESVIYFDGLGRPMQSIGIRAGGNSEDVITHIEYDAFGRQGKDYLPYATTTNNGLYRINALSVTNAYYLSKHPNDINSTAPNPYSEKLFEDSPLNRIEFQGAPGKDWKANNTYYDHSIQFNYQTNTAIEVLV